MAQKYTIEVALICETTPNGNFCEREFIFQKQVSGMFHTALLKPSMGRKACRLFERPGKVASGQATFSGDVSEGDIPL
nr:hypothetical protein [Acidisoma cellulosilyticum]